MPLSHSDSGRPLHLRYPPPPPLSFSSGLSKRFVAKRRDAFICKRPDGCSPYCLLSAVFFFPSRQLKKKKPKPIQCLFSAIQKRSRRCHCSWAADFPGRLAELHHATCSGGEGTQEVPARRQRLTEVFFFSSPCHSFANAALPAMLGQVTETASLESCSCRNNFKVSLLQSGARQHCTVHGIQIAFRITAKCIMTNLLGSWWRRQEKKKTLFKSCVNKSRQETKVCFYAQCQMAQSR